MARVRLLREHVTVRRVVGWSGGGNGGGGSSGKGGCGDGSGGGGDGVGALVRPCWRAPKGTGVGSVYPSGAFSGPSNTSVPNPSLFGWFGSL